MAQYGLDNFVYDLTVKDGSAVFTFRDPQDAGNTAEVTVASKDFPDGGKAADDRSVADLAYSQASQKLNDARAKRLEKEAADAESAKQAEDKKARDAAQDFFANSQDVAVAPARVDKDGTTVYNTAGPEDDKKTDK